MDDRGRGVTRVQWSNAGHPPPVVIHPDGTVVPLADSDADLLLGIDASTERTESSVVLERGATVLLFTDGLVERRRQSIEDGLAALGATLTDLTAQDVPLDALCDQVLARMLPSRREDDVALVAVRLHPRDE